MLWQCPTLHVHGIQSLLARACLLSHPRAYKPMLQGNCHPCLTLLDSDVPRKALVLVFADAVCALAHGMVV